MGDWMDDFPPQCTEQVTLDELARAIRVMRIIAGVSQVRLAARAGMSAAEVEGVESLRVLEWPTQRRILIALGFEMQGTAQRPRRPRDRPPD
jgi:hypothetical protein